MVAGICQPGLRIRTAVKKLRISSDTNLKILNTACPLMVNDLYKQNVSAMYLDLENVAG